MKFVLKSAVGTVVALFTLIMLGVILFSCGSSNDKNPTTPPGGTSENASPAATASVPAEYRAALDKAQSYAEMMNMSKKGIYQQLTSPAEKFPKAAAQYAVDNVKADYKANALAKAKSYQESMSMSKSAIRSQLTSTIEGFTATEADYAIANLNK